MFWRRSSKSSQEPKTPRLSSIPLHPDSYVPTSYHRQPYDPTPHYNYSQAAPAMQAMAPMVDPRYSHSKPTSTKSRARTMSTSSVKGMLDVFLQYFFDLVVKPRHRFGLTLHKASFLMWAIRIGWREPIPRRHASHQSRVWPYFPFIWTIQ